MRGIYENVVLIQQIVIKYVFYVQISYNFSLPFNLCKYVIEDMDIEESRNNL